MWNVDIVAYLEYYTNTAGIEIIDYGGNYPEDPNGVVTIPSGAPRTLTFTLRNPQNYNLNVSLADWVDGNAPSIPGDYTIEQSPNDKSKIILTFKEPSLLSWDKSGGKDLSATVKIQDQESLRDFDDYVYTLAVNSPPIAPSNVSLVKHEDVSKNWFFAFDAGTTLERQGLHGDIASVTINNRRYDLTTSDGNLNVDDGLSIENPDATNILESAEGLAFIHNEGNSVYLSTEVPTDSSPTYTVFFTDNRGLNSNAITVSSAGKVREHYYVDENGSDEDGTGSANNPLRTVEAALDEVVRVNNQSSVFTIHIKGNVSGDSSDVRGSTVIESDSTLNLRLQGWGEGTITADANKRVMYVGGSGANVTLGENLTLTGGEAEDGGGVYVASGKLTLDGAVISNNTASHIGGGVYIASSSTLIMNEGTIGGVTAVKNRADEGGGVYVHGTFTMNGGTISGNLATSGAGVVSSGIFTMSGGTIGGTGAEYKNSASSGGGVYIANGNTFTMSGTASIKGNTATGNGGGVYIEDGSFTMKGGYITNNGEAEEGSGVYLSNASTFTMENGIIEENRDSIAGGGVAVNGNSTFIMRNGSIQNNDSRDVGGGVYVNNSTFSMTGGTITKNNVKLSGSSRGGGVYLENANFTMSGGTIYKNTSVFNGGGIYIVDGSTFTMNNASARIEENSAIAGGGVYLHTGIFNLSAGTITGNKLYNDPLNGGGGIYINHTMDDNKTLNLSGNPSVTGNKDSDGSTEDNINFMNNASLSPVKISGSLNGGEIGLTPLYIDGGEIVVQGGVTDANKGFFTSDLAGVSFYRGGSNLKVFVPIDEIYIGNTPTGTGDGFTIGNIMAVTNETQFNNAISKLTRDSGTLWVTETIEINANTTWAVGFEKDVTLKRYSGFDDLLIAVTGGELILQNITVDGNGDNYSADAPLIRVDFGTILNLNYGTTLINNINEGSTGEGGAIYSSGTINLKDGSSITKNIADKLGSHEPMSPGIGGGIYASAGTINMYGGAEIALNNAKGQEAKGGGVALFNGAMFNFYGGTINDNDNTNDSSGDNSGGDQKGGCVYIDDSTLIISGSTAIIRDNDSDEGGGVYMVNGELSMSAGSITGNDATVNGGGVHIAGGTLELSRSPIIKNNTYNRADTNNVYFTNALSASPIKITDELTGDASIGLSPSNKTGGYILVQNDDSVTIDTSKFTLDSNPDNRPLIVSEADNLIVGYIVGDRGPAGGIVFDITLGAHREISNDLGKHGKNAFRSYAFSYSVNGYSNWEAPTLSEMELVYDRLKTGVLYSDTKHYWIDTNNATVFNFDNKTTYLVNDDVSHNLRAIRTFAP